MDITAVSQNSDCILFRLSYLSSGSLLTKDNNKSQTNGRSSSAYLDLPRTNQDSSAELSKKPKKIRPRDRESSSLTSHSAATALQVRALLVEAFKQSEPRLLPSPAQTEHQLTTS